MRTLRHTCILWVYGLFMLQSVAPAADSSFSRRVLDNGFAGDVKAIGDIDNDGFPDLVIGGYQMYWYEYPTWTRHSIGSANVEFTTDMQLADVDNDGDLDAVTGDGNGSNNVLWLENPQIGGNPANPWARHVIGTHGDWCHDIEVGDIDRDGRVDVVVRKTSTEIYFQNSPNSWTKRDISSVATGWEGMGMGDIDRDGDLDLALNGRWIETPLSPRTNAFSAHSVASGYPEDTTAAIGDINRDGRPDILFAAQHQRNKFAWYEGPVNPATGVWTEHIVDSNMGGHKVNIGDLNGDGLADIALGLELTELSVYDQQTNGAFVKHVLSSSGIHNQRIGDLGNDGDLDIFGANYLGNPPVELWENQQAGGSDTTAPSAPAGLSGSANSPTQIVLSWSAATDNVGVTGYRVYRCQGASCTATTEVGTSPNTGFTDNGVVANTAYRYRVRAYDAASNLGAYSSAVTVTTPTGGSAPMIGSFTAAPASIAPGQSTTLSWSVTGATGLTLNPGNISVTGTTSRAVSPSSTTTYTLVANNSFGSSDSSAVVTVTSPTVVVSVSPASATLTASQTRQFTATVTGNSNTAVTWSLSPGVGSISGTGLYTAPSSINTTQVVTVQATSQADPTKSDTASVTLVPPPSGGGPTIQSFTASPASIQIGQSTTLSWSVTGATYVLLNPGNRNVTSLTSVSFAPDNTATYTLTASSDGGTTSATTTVTVGSSGAGGGNVAVSVSPTSASLSPSQTRQFTATVTGASNNAVTWSISPGVGSITSSGLYTAPASISSTQSVTLRATSQADSSRSATATVTLNPPASAPVISSFTASPATIQPGQSSTLSWQVAGASSLTLNPGNINVTGTTSRSVSPGGTTNYSLSATNASGTTTATTSVGIASVSITVTPGSATLTPSQSQQFAATVTGSANTGVTWSVNPNIGIVSASGLYSAPSTLDTSQTVFVIATSQADSSKSATASVTLNPSSPPPPPPSGLVAYWPFSEGSGPTTSDASGNGRTATLSGASWTGSGRTGSGIDLAGTNSYVNAGTFDVPGSAITLSTWFKADSYPSSSDPRIISKASGTAEQDHYFMLSVLNGSQKLLRVRLKIGGTTRTLVAASGSLPTGQWVHAATTYDGSVIRLFLNGTQVGSAAASGVLSTSASVPVWIGSNPVGGNGFDGVIDEVRIYNRALSATELQALWQSGN